MIEFQRTLYLDMDGVLVDFDKEFFERFPNITPDRKDELSSSEFWDTFNTKSDCFFLNAPAFPDLADHVAEIVSLSDQHGFAIEILTALPKLSRYPTAKLEKKKWLENQGLDFIPFNIGPHAEDKQKHCHKGDILIDDNVLNIVQWNGRGGIGIFHTNFKTTIKYLKTLLDHEAKVKVK